MKIRNVASLFTVALIAVAAIPAHANTDLIISEYVEGSGSNKAIEIWNNTGGPIDMGAGLYKLRVFSNGSPTVSATINLTAVLAQGATWVVVNPLAGIVLLPLADQTSGSLSHNGNDAIVLAKGAGNTTVDAFGQVGFDPLTQWGTGLQSTEDNTLRRKASVCDGDVDGSNVFDPSIEWDGFAVDTFGGIRAHTDNCGPVPATPSSWGSVKTLYR